MFRKSQAPKPLKRPLFGERGLSRIVGLGRRLKELAADKILVSCLVLAGGAIGGLELQAMGVGQPWITLLSTGCGGIVLGLALVIYDNWLAVRIETHRERKQRLTFAFATYLEQQADSLYRWEGKTRTGRDLPPYSSKDGPHVPLPTRRMTDATDEQAETMFDQVHAGKMREVYHELLNRKLVKTEDRLAFYNLPDTKSKLALADRLISMAEDVRGSVH